MLVSTWKNGKQNIETGAGYGVRISNQDFHKYFQDKSVNITIKIGDIIHNFTLSKSFFKKCHEIRSKEIGVFLIQHKVHMWKKYHPNKLNLEYISDGKYKLIK